MCLNHSKPTTTTCPPRPPLEKFSSMKPLSGAKKFGDCFSMHCDLLMYLILDFILRTILFMENMNWMKILTVNSCVYKAIKSPCSGLAIAESIFRYSCAACSGTSSPASREKGFTGGPDSQESACNAGEPGSIPESERYPGEGNDNPLQYSCLENSMDRGT